MADFYVSVGDQVRFSKTVSESDVYLFAGITGDLAPEPRRRGVHARHAATGGGSPTVRS